MIIIFNDFLGELEIVIETLLKGSSKVSVK